MGVSSVESTVGKSTFACGGDVEDEEASLGMRLSLREPVDGEAEMEGVLGRIFILLFRAD